MSQPTQDLRLTIRKGIRKFQASKHAATPIPLGSLSSAHDHLAETVRISKQIDRLQELKRSQSDELAELAGAISNLGQCPAGPPTLRARLGRWVIGFLNRLLWWKAEENRHVGDLMLQISRRQAEQLEILGAELENRSRLTGSGADPFVTSASLRSQVLADQADLDHRLREVEGVLLDLESLRSVVASSFEGAGGVPPILKEVFRRIEVSEQTIQRLGQNYAELQKELTEARSKFAAQFEGVEDKVGTVGRRLADLGLQNQRLRTDVSLQDRRLSVFLAEARKRLPKALDQEQLQTLLSGEGGQLDSLYLAFEDIYRGARSEIKERQSIYLPLLRNAGAGSELMSILDLGCGRGEWLELLADEGWEARGVDANHLMLQECRERGLKVERADVLDYLQGTPDATLGVVSAFHVVEHIPFERLMLLIDEALRVLRPNGILILETPNPDNLMVAASTFYLDPTHIRPIPSGTLRFVVEARGFSNVEVWNLHPMPESARLPEDASGAASRLNELICGPRDYAVIGRRL